jgi:hypothetical protein
MESGLSAQAAAGGTTLAANNCFDFDKRFAGCKLGTGGRVGAVDKSKIPSGGRTITHGLRPSSSQTTLRRTSSCRSPISSRGA